MANLASVLMPKWGMEMTEGELAEWHVAIGDKVSAGSDIVDVETAKIVNTVTCNNSGEIVRLCAAIGDVVPVGGLLAIIADGAVSEEEIDSFIASSSASQAPEATVDAPTVAVAAKATAETNPLPQNAPTTLSQGPDDAGVAASAVARRAATARHARAEGMGGGVEGQGRRPERPRRPPRGSSSQGRPPLRRARASARQQAVASTGGCVRRQACSL